MSFEGHVENGQIVPDEPATLPEGAKVRVEVLSIPPSAADIPTLYERLKPFAGILDGLPEDAAANHDHSPTSSAGRPTETDLLRSMLPYGPTLPTTIVPASSALYAQGLNLFAGRADKEWSLTDCMSFHAMLERGLIDALTSDEHFEQAGFRRLLMGS